MPKQAGGQRTAEVDVNITDRPSLVRFAAVALVDLTGLPRKEVAARMGKSGAGLTQHLLGRTDRDAPITKAFCQQLQRLLTVLAAEDADGWLRSPRLTSLYEELVENREPDSGVRVDAEWFLELARSGPARSAVEVLLRGEALWAMIKDIPERRDAEILFTDLDVRLDVDRTLSDLLSVAGWPPADGARAINLVARLGPVALPAVRRELYEAPVGFRSMRILTRMLWQVKLDRRHGDERNARRDKKLCVEIEKLLHQIQLYPTPDPYPARSLYVEALRYAPDDWSWVPRRLAERATDPARPVRERMYAARLARLRGYTEMDHLIERLEEDGLNEEGLAYTAAVLRATDGRMRGSGWLDEHGRVPVTGLRAWPDGRQEAKHVNVVLAALNTEHGLSIPGSVQQGTKVLISEALLGLDGTYRRRACDVLSIAGLADPAAMGVAHLLRFPEGLTAQADEPVPIWLQENAAFVLGYLHQQAAVDALETVVSHPEKFADRVVHAAAWGLGDRLSWAARLTRNHAVPVEALSRLTEHGSTSVRQAATYALAVVQDEKADELVSALVRRTDLDRLTRGLARWGMWLREADLVRGRHDALQHIADSRTLVKS